MGISIHPFENRAQAGRELAAALEDLREADCFALAVPRGGVVVGYEVALELGIDLDVIVPRKIGAPGQPELAIGAVASWGNHERIVDSDAVRYLGVDEDYIDRQVRQELAEVNRRLLAYRGTTEPPDVVGRNVILIDDGIATGYTTRAAAVALRKLGAGEVILAVPVAPPEALQTIKPYVDRVVCLKTPTPFMAVGYWYHDFAQVSDSEVVELLRKARQNRSDASR
jgi:predicted phosphoribosyltransferase